MNSKKNIFFFEKSINVIYFSCEVRQMGILAGEQVAQLVYLLQYGFQNNPFGYSLFRTLVIPIQIVVYKVFG